MISLLLTQPSSIILLFMFFCKKILLLFSAILYAHTSEACHTLGETFEKCLINYNILCYRKHCYSRDRLGLCTCGTRIPQLQL